MNRMYDDLNYQSEMFPNQCVSGHDPALYPPTEKDVPRRYHEKLKKRDKKNLYPELYKDDTEEAEDPGEPDGQREYDLYKK